MGIRILIIEAENRFRKNLYQLLQAEGFIVDKITPQDDIAAIISREKIDAVLLGVDGLGRAGLALIRPIKTIRPDTKIIIINQASRMDLSIKGMALGAFDEVLVPLDIELLSRRIRDAVDG